MSLLPSCCQYVRYQVLFILLLLILTGCAVTSERVAPPCDKPPAVSDPATNQTNQVAAGGHGHAAKPDMPPEAEISSSCGECQSVNQEGQRDSCFSLQPGKTVPCARSVKGKNGRKRTVKSTRTSRCQPQSLIYARCRSGIDTCRLGDTSPLQWFACARKNGATASKPQVGSVIILASNKGHCMPTGHPAYVEEVCPNKDGTWTLRLSHTNYDRRCHLDLDAKVNFSPKTMQARFATGPWSTWGNNLKVLGFIVR